MPRVYDIGHQLSYYLLSHWQIFDEASMKIHTPVKGTGAFEAFSAVSAIYRGLPLEEQCIE